MTWDVATARARIGLPEGDTSNDAQLQVAMKTAQALAERYCDRRFSFKAGDTATFRPPKGCALHVYRWPIKTVTSVQALSDDGSVDHDLTAWWADLEEGVVFLRERWSSVCITFDGGFETFPEDLEFALWLIFDQVWSTTPGMGLPVGVIGGDGGPVRSFSIDGMSIGYDTSAADGSASGGGASAWGAIPAWSIALLEYYRAETVVGVG